MAKDLFSNKLFFSFLFCLASVLGWGQTFTANFSDITGSGGNDGLWSGNVASTALNSYNTGGTWTLINSFKGSECLKLGTSSKLGSLETPALTGLSGNGTLTFRAGAWDGDKNTLNLSISGGGSLSVTSVTLVNSSFSNYSINVTGITATTKIKFSGQTASNSRFFIDDINITTVSQAPNISTNPSSVPTMTASVGGANDTKTILVSGGNLTGNISATISGANASQFSVNPSAFTASGGVVSSQNLAITYIPSIAAGTHNAVLTLSSPGAADVVLNLSGTTVDIPTGGEGILTFDFNGLVGDEITATSNYNITPGLTNSTTSRGTGISAAANGNRFNATGWTTATTISPNDYMEFTITPENGYQFNVTTIQTKIQASSTGPTKAVLRSSVDNFAANIGSVKNVGTSSDLIFTVNQSLSQTAVIYRIYMYQAGSGSGSGGFEGTGNDIVVNGNVLPIVSCSFPTTQASNFVASNISNTSGTISWSNGSGNKVLVVAREGSDVNNDPLSGTSYTANAAFGAGSQIGIGNFVIYNGIGNSVNLTGLVSGKSYYFAVYSYNDVTNCYNLNQLKGSFSTLSPPNPPTNLTKVCTTGTSQQLSWTAPEGTFDGYLLVARENQSPHSVNNIVASSQSFNLIYTSAPVFGTPETSRVLYIGNQNNVTVTGLTEGVSYTFALYAYNNNGASATLYSSSISTTQIIGVSDVSYELGSAGNTKADISWQNPTAGCYDEILAVVTSSSGITFTPSGNGSSYTADNNYTGNNQVVYKGTNNNFEITSLVNGVSYYVEIFVRKGTQWSKGVEVNVTPSSGTIFKAGDLFFVGYDGQYLGSNTGTTSDQYLVATLVDIYPGTNFSLVNSRFEAGALANERTNKWGGSGNDASSAPGVAFITYKGSNVIPKGSVFVFNTDETLNVFDNIFVITSDNNNLVNSSNNRRNEFQVSVPFGFGSAPNISITKPDQIFLIQGTFVSDGTIDANQANYILNGTLLHGLSNRTAWVPLSSANSGGFADNNRTSRLPAELECFNLYYPSSNTIAGYYENDKLHNGTLRDILLSVNDPLNWTYLSGNEIYYLEPATYDDLSAGRTFSESGGKPAGTWVSTADTNWYYCKNWENLRVPDKKTDVFIGNIAGTVKAVIENGAPFSDLYKDLAVVKDLNISSNSVEMKGSILEKLIVFGDVNLTGSGVLDLDDNNNSIGDGIIDLYGNWNNAVGINNFKEGNSTVNFLGSFPQIINSNNHNLPEEFYNIVLGNDFETKTSNNLIANGKLTVNNGKTLLIGKDDFVKINNELINNGNVTVESDGNLVQINDNAVNTGTITAIRNIKIKNTASREEYNYLISPIKNFNIKNIFNNDPAFIKYTLYHNELNEKFYVSSGAYIPGRGLAVKEPYATSNGVSVEFKDADGVTTYAPAKFVGEPANGIIDFTLAKAGNGYNLVGNPYPSTIDLKTLYENNSTRINPLTNLPEDPIESTFNFWDNSNNAIYVQQGTLYSGNSYARYNAVSDTGTPAGTNRIPLTTDVTKLNRYAKVGQGFMVKAKATGKILQFKNSIRVPNNNNAKFFSGKSTRKSSEIKDRFWISLVAPNNIVNTQAIVYFDEGNNDFAADDSEAKSLSSNLFYSFAGNQKVLINGRSVFTDADIVPLGGNFFSQGTYSIHLVAKQGVFENGQNIYLKDKKTGETYNLGDTSYTFTTDSGDISNRFEIVYQAKTLETNESIINDLKIYKDNEEFVVKSTRTISEIKVYDASGKLIHSAKPNRKEFRVLANHFSSGVYFITVNQDGSIKTVKLIK